MKSHFHESNTKGNIVIRVAAVMLCLTLFSTYLVTGLLARYSTSSQSGDYARAAKFSIERSGVLSQTIAADIAPGSTKAMDITIENKSEVAVEYTVEIVKETNNLPLTFRLGEGGAENPNRITFTDRQAPVSTQKTYTLNIGWKAEDNSPERMGMVDHITVTVTAAQID